MALLAEPEAPASPAAHYGVVVEPPAKLGDPFTVLVPDFDDLHVFQIRRWEYRGATLPAKDDKCLVVVDDEAEPWVAAWWPAAGDVPVYPGMVSITDFGANVDEATHDTILRTALTAMAGTGGAIYVPPTFPLRLVDDSASFVVDGCELIGLGIHDYGGMNYGSRIFLEGDWETSTKHVFVIKHGGIVGGIGFAYPTESVANSAPAITATGYVLRLEETHPRKGGIARNNYLPGVPFGISNYQGWSEIVSNKIAATKVCIHDEEEFAEHQMNHNQMSLGLWNGAREGAINAYVAQNGICMKLSKTLIPSAVGNTGFGYRDGVCFEGYGQFTNFIGGTFDGCRYPVRVLAGAGPIDATFTGVTLGSLVAGNPAGVRDNYATIESNCVNIGKPASRVNISFVNCQAEGANGDLIIVQNTGGSAAVNLSVEGGQWSSMGRFSHTHTMPVSSVVGAFTGAVTSNDGDKITGGTSGATAFVRKLSGGTLYLDVVLGTFQAGETVTGSKSGATAKVTSIAQAPRYCMIRFTDDQHGNLSVSTQVDMTAYLWGSGVWVLGGGLISVQGCSFNSLRSTTSYCFQVNAADRVVEGANCSEVLAGGVQDTLFAAGVSVACMPSNWSRPPSLSIASTATMTLPGATTELAIVTGTTEITSVKASRPGHRVTLKFNGALTVKDGSNLKLKENFVSTEDDTLTLVCDGVSWYEVARSAN